MSAGAAELGCQREVRNVCTQGLTFAIIWLPMHAVKYAAATIFTLCFQQCTIPNGYQWTRIALWINACAIIFVGNECEAGVVAERSRQCLEHCRTKCRMSRWVCWERRCECFSCCRVDYRCAKWLPSWVGNCVSIAIFVRTANTGYRTPMVVEIFAVPCCDTCIAPLLCSQRPRCGHIPKRYGHVRCWQS